MMRHDRAGMKLMTARSTVIAEAQRKARVASARNAGVTRSAGRARGGVRFVGREHNLGRRGLGPKLGVGVGTGPVRVRSYTRRGHRIRAYTRRR